MTTQPHTQAGDANTKRTRVLVIDDSRVIRKAVEKILGAEFAIQEAEDGEAGWEKLAADGGIEVVVSDIEMPRLDGYGLLCRIRASEQEHVRDVPVIVITGAQDDQTRERALACGATDFITKPLDGVQLLARARAHANQDHLVSDVVESAAALDQKTLADPLTGLHSRRYFLERGAQDLAHAKRHGADLSVIVLELDDYASHYRSLGAPVCEEIQKWLAGLLRKTTRTEDTSARLGEGVFGVIAPATGRMDSAVLCERIRAALKAEPFRHQDHTTALTVSLGLANAGRDPDDRFDLLLKLADQRMILAKAAGGDRLGSLYQDELPPPEEAVMEMPDLETALQLLENGESGKLLPYLPELALKVLPLLEESNRQLALDLGFEIEALKEKLSALE
jgi:diguanylate cyclase (GGDEF)-like protein